MPTADVLIVEENADGIFLSRYARDGGFAGDTWHESIEEAFDQARAEFQIERGAWREIPATADTVEYALEAARF